MTDHTARRHPVQERAFRLVQRRSRFEWSESVAFTEGSASTERFLARLGPRLRYAGANVLDVGCGHGRTCFHLAEAGAARVVGVDIDAGAIEFALKTRDREYAHLADRVDFRLIADIHDLAERDFDLILSQDAFEHILTPERYVEALVDRLAPGGQLAIGFGPLWLSPTGGHVGHVTWLPWAHLVFSEQVVMGARRRVHANAHPADTWSQYGLNRMSLKRFLQMMDRDDLAPVQVRTNVHEKRLRSQAFGALRRVPIVGDLFAFNVYGIWRRV